MNKKQTSTNSSQAEKKNQEKSLEKKATPITPKQTDWQDKYLRLYAEFENYKKRTSKEQLRWLEIANKNLILMLLPIIEDFERALNTHPKDENNHQIPRQGIQMIHEKFFNILQKEGLKPMDIKKGDNPDPHCHEVLTTTPVKDEKLKGKIAQIVSKGYLLNKKVIQVAKIIIGA